MITLVATDLDGTLLRSDKTVSPRNQRALEAARTAGITVAFVTGRPPRWLAPVVDQTGWHGLAVAANGAVLLDLEKRQIEATLPISPESITTAVDVLRGRLPGVRFATEHAHVGSAVPAIHPIAADGTLAVESLVAGVSAFGHEPGYLGGTLKMPEGAPTADIAELAAVGDVIKLLARAPDEHPEHPDAVSETLATELADVVTVTHSTTRGILLEISAAGVNKATGLELLCERHGVAASQVAAVGDMPNDLAMLEWSRLGYAVANAHPRVLDHVGSNIVASNHDDGVAELLESLISSC